MARTAGGRAIGERTRPPVFRLH